LPGQPKSNDLWLRLRLRWWGGYFTLLKVLDETLISLIEGGFESPTT